MKENSYKMLLNYIKQNKKREKIISLFIQYCPLIDITIYPLLLIYIYLNQKDSLLKCILIPAFSFLICTVVRKYINAPRPYEVYALIPLTSHSKGESFPSRHTLSAFAIGYCALYISIPLGIFTLAFAFLVAISRIAGALHFPKDVFAGFLLASILALLYLI